MQFHNYDDDTLRKLALTYRKLLRSADGRVVLQVGASPDAETKIRTVVCNGKPRTNTCARTSGHWRGKKVCTFRRSVRTYF